MKKRLLLVALALLSTLSFAQGEFDAATFHQQHCMACHGTEVYTRPNHRVQSLARLESQVRMCDANLQIKLFDDDILALTRFLNQNFYHFPEK